MDTNLYNNIIDNKINQVILQTWMKKHNIKHSSAMNGQEAVEKWKGGGFHLVLVSQYQGGDKVGYNILQDVYMTTMPTTISDSG